MLRKFKFYLIGLVPGIIIVFFILNKKGASCSGYLPNSRVLAETVSKKFMYSEDFRKSMEANKIDEKTLKETIIPNCEIDFDRSHAQKKPCPDYVLTYPETNPNLEITFQKCKDEVTFHSLKSIK